MRWWLLACVGCVAFAACGDNLPAPGQDAPPCIGTLLFACPERHELKPLVLDKELIATDADRRCEGFHQDNGPQLCVIFGTTIDVGQVQVTGTKPLVLVARDTLRISNTVEVSSRRNTISGPGANALECDQSTLGAADTGGGGGGAGGSFGTAGGTGGAGAAGAAGGSAGAAQPTITVIRGGCTGTRGGDGTLTGDGGLGGNGGGGIYLLSRGSIVIEANGAIYASGAGGEGGNNATSDRGAGGGGGSGGLIALEAPTVIVDGILAANGGAGGGGGDLESGHPGADGSTIAFDTPAVPGAAEGATTGGAGGAGSALTTSPENGHAPSGTGAGGGGGGGTGVIWIRGGYQGGQRVSPPPQQQ
jgi:hypothetical protein